jgi:hypothetical protein
MPTRSCSHAAVNLEVTSHVHARSQEHVERLKMGGFKDN